MNGGGQGFDMFAKVGPLPAWAWGAIAVVGYIFWSHRQASAVPVATDGTTDTVPATDGVTTTNDYGYATPGVDPSSAGYDYSTVNGGGYTGTTSGTAFTSNQEWGVKAIAQLIASGVSASTATSGVTHYLAGATLTTDEGNAVNLAITELGPPPLPLPVNIGSTVGVPTQPVPSSGGGSSPTPEPAPAPVVSTTPSAPAPSAPSGWTAPTYETGYGSKNPYIASDGISLTGTAVAQVIAKLALHGIKAQTSQPSGTGWEGWAPNLYIINLRSSVSSADPLAPYRTALSQIVSPYSSADTAQKAMASL